MITSLDLGSARLDLVFDAYGEVNGNDVFSPATRAEWSVGLEPNAKDGLVVASHALLIREGQANILVDTGWGEVPGWRDPQGAGNTHNVIQGLKKLGLDPGDIQRIVITHAHGDHVCGNTVVRGGCWVSAFPQAEFIIQEAEVEAARRDEGVWSMFFAPLEERGQLHAIRGRADLGPSVTCWPTPGHTIGHQSVLIHTPQRQVLWLGDLAVLARNMERLEWGHSWAWSLEADRRSRREVAEWAIAAGATVLIGHDPVRTAATVERAGNAYRLVPLPA